MKAIMDIQFPPGSDEPKCDWLGRNGQYMNHGLFLTYTRRETVMVEPMTGRGHMGRCLIEFPKSVIPQMIEFLLQHGDKEKIAEVLANYDGATIL